MAFKMMMTVSMLVTTSVALPIMDTGLSGNGIGDNEPNFVDFYTTYTKNVPSDPKGTMNHAAVADNNMQSIENAANKRAENEPNFVDFYVIYTKDVPSDPKHATE